MTNSIIMVKKERPETKILRKWLEEHLEDPYPSRLEKLKLEAKTGWAMKKIDEWFTNARQRYVEPKLRRKPNPSYQRFDENVKNILVSWLLENEGYPDPKTRKKLMKKTGLSDRQIYNWFTNARTRNLRERLTAEDKTIASSEHEVSTQSSVDNCMTKVKTGNVTLKMEPPAALNSESSSSWQMLDAVIPVPSDFHLASHGVAGYGSSTSSRLAKKTILQDSLGGCSSPTNTTSLGLSHQDMLIGMMNLEPITPTESSPSIDHDLDMFFSILDPNSLCKSGEPTTFPPADPNPLKRKADTLYEHYYHQFTPPPSEVTDMRSEPDLSPQNRRRDPHQADNHDRIFDIPTLQQKNKRLHLDHDDDLQIPS